jgi:hypothetical protein
MAHGRRHAVCRSRRACRNALIAENNFTRLVLMMEGYKRADLAVAHSRERTSDRDFLVYPIIFNYRQFIELSLKYQLATHGREVGIAANWNTHNLESLWQEFQQMLDSYGNPDSDSADPSSPQQSRSLPRSIPNRTPIATGGSEG